MIERNAAIPDDRQVGFRIGVNVGDVITKEIVSAPQVNLTDGEVAFVMARGTNDTEAWQLCVRATELFMRFNPTDYLEARTLVERAIKLDPNYAYAWATLGFTWWWDGRLGYTGETQSKFERADEYARKAMELDSTVSWAIGLSAMAAAPLGRYEAAIEDARRGVGLYPGNADIRAFLTFTLMHAGQFEEAEEHYKAAMLLNPFYPACYAGGLSTTLRCLERLDEALAFAEENLARPASLLQGNVTRAFVSHVQGQTEKAKASLAEIQRLAPDLRTGHLAGLVVVNDERSTDKLVSALRELGLPD